MYSGKPVAKGGISGPGPPVDKLAPPVKILPIFFCADLILHMEPLKLKKSELKPKKSPAFVLIIAQYNSQSDSDYMYVSVNMKENEY